MFYSLYSKTAFSCYGTSDNSIQSLQTNAKAMMAQLQERHVLAMDENVGGDYVITLLSPIMQRAHSLT